MNVFLLILLILLHSFQSFFCKLFTANCKKESVSTPLFAILFGGVIGLVTLASDGFSFTPSLVTWLFGFGNAIVLFLYNISLVGCVKRGSYAFTNICSVFGGVLVPMAISLILWGDTLTLIQIIAIVMMLASFILINVRSLSLKGTQGTFFFFCLLLFLSNGLYGAVLDGQQRLVGTGERSEMIVISYIGMALLSAVWLLAVQKKQFFSSFRMGGRALACGFASGAAAVAAVNLLMYMISAMPSTIVFTVDNGGVMVMAAVFAALFLREKITAAQLPGYALSLISLVMLGL